MDFRKSMLDTAYKHKDGLSSILIIFADGEEKRLEEQQLGVSFARLMLLMDLNPDVKDTVVVRTLNERKTTYIIVLCDLTYKEFYIKDRAMIHQIGGESK